MDDPTRIVTAMTVGRLLKLAKDCDMAAFQGYKGKDYIMTMKTPVWVSNYSQVCSTGIWVFKILMSMIA